MSQFNKFQWSKDIENVLDKIRINCVTLTKYNKEQYYKYKGYLKYFRIPTIILSAVGSVVSVGFKPYLTQDTISITTCFIGLTVGIVNSVELFLTIQSNMEKSLSHSKDFYLLSIDIYKILSLETEHRYISGKDYLETKYNEYCKLIESAELIDQKINDSLLPLEIEQVGFIRKLFNRKYKPASMIEEKTVEVPILNTNTATREEKTDTPTREEETELEMV